MDYSLLGSSVRGDSLGKNTGVGCHCLPPGDFPNPGIKPRSPELQADSLPSEPPGKPRVSEESGMKRREIFSFSFTEMVDLMEVSGIQVL